MMVDYSSSVEQTCSSRVEKRAFEMRKIDSLGRVQSMDSYTDVYNITACRVNYQLLDRSIFEQLYQENGKSYNCRSCART